MLANAPPVDVASRPGEEDSRGQYTREDALRLLNVSERRLKSWEKQGLIAPAEHFGFRELIALRALQKLSDCRIPPRQIGQAIASLKSKLSGVEQPLNELRIVSDGKTIAVHVAGQRMEAISGQLLFDFEALAPSVRTLQPKQEAKALPQQEAEGWFQKGLALEETGAPTDQVLEAYTRAIALNPDAAGALVNLGTIHFRARRLAEATRFYERAIQADERYPLAHFNLGNVFDELGDRERAREQYEIAVRMNPDYADAHFNLALIAERDSDNLRALKHWKAYLKLDATSQWATQARKQLDRLRKLTLVE